MRRYLIGLALVVAACGGPRIVTSSPAGVTVDMGVVGYARNSDLTPVNEIAANHCAKFDKEARLTGFGRADGRLALYICR